MERKLITCPETAHLEQIDYESTPFGILIACCTRFQPHDAVACARECAARLDRRWRHDTLDGDDDDGGLEVLGESPLP